MKVETLCSQNSISKANCYYRLRRVREFYIETTQSCETSFVELSVISGSENPEKQESKDRKIIKHI